MSTNTSMENRTFSTTTEKQVAGSDFSVVIALRSLISWPSQVTNQTAFASLLHVETETGNLLSQLASTESTIKLSNFPDVNRWACLNMIVPKLWKASVYRLVDKSSEDWANTCDEIQNKWKSSYRTDRYIQVTFYKTFLLAGWYNINFRHII